MSESDTSNSTIEPVYLERIFDALDRGAEEAEESKDYLTYSTLLDIHLSNPKRYSHQEREDILGHLLAVMKKHPDLTYEIGWDLPALIIPYVVSNFAFNAPVRGAPCVYKVVKIFQFLATAGNPKELLLKSCELLSSLKIEDVEYEEDEEEEEEEEEEEDSQKPLSDSEERHEKLEKYFDIKVWCIFELIDSCLHRLETVYPSRFLSMAVTSFINTVYVNRGLSREEFIIKRAYSFIRNYSAPKLPAETSFSDEELAKIKDDEEYLQRKLLTGFLTHVYFLSTEQYSLGFTVNHLKYLEDPKYVFVPAQVTSRVVELAISLDISLLSTFKTFVADSHALFDSFDYSTDEVELTGEIFEKVVIDYQKNLAGSIVDSDSNSIHDSVPGILLFFTYSTVQRKKYNVPFSFKDALVFTLRLIIPGMVSQHFSKRSLKDLALYWIWYAFYQSDITDNKIELVVSSVPKPLLTIFYQVLLFISFDDYLLNESLTTLTKVLTVSPEEIGYSFVIDTLHNGPYDSIKARMVRILKELLTKKKIEEEKKALEQDKENNEKKVGEDISTKLSKVSLNAPPLPSREVSASTTYYTFDQSKWEDIEELLTISNDEAFVEVDKTITIESAKLSSLTAYLNLLVILKDHPVLIKNKPTLDSVLQKVKDNIASVKAKYSDNEKSLEYNAAGILQIALDRIG